MPTTATPHLVAMGCPPQHLATMESLVAQVQAIPGFNPVTLFGFLSKYATMMPQIATFFTANGGALQSALAFLTSNSGSLSTMLPQIATFISSGSLQSVLSFFTTNGSGLQTALTDLMSAFGVVIPTPTPPAP
jgi:hypothetical protein